jgi:hypothetical protein
MAYGPDGSDHPQEPPRRGSQRQSPPQPAGDWLPRADRPAPARPQPYDPYQTRARDRAVDEHGVEDYQADLRNWEPDRSAPTTVLDAADLRANRTGATGAPHARARAAGGGMRPGGPAAGTPVNRRKGKKIVPPTVKRRRKRVRRALLGVFLIVFGYVGVSLYPYLTGPGTDTTSARVAEWARDHGLGAVVTWLENNTYSAPAVGGQLSADQLAQLQGPAGKARGKADEPADIAPLAFPGLSGEGVWHPLTTDGAGDPVIEKAALRPDAQHTSALAYAVWMNQRALKFSLHPGYQEPGGTWSQASSIPADQRTGLVAAWNGGFKIVPDDALGGYYADGRTAVPLVDGKAAEVFYRDGSIKVGQWGRDETMGPTVIGVRQNLSLLVDGGQVTVGPNDGSGQEWGYTINNSYFIARSGVGMTAHGDMVYVSGSELSVFTLAKLLQAAGAVYGMELDINPDWITFMSFGGSDPANPTPTKLWNFTQPADRYFQPSTRDFVTVYAR